MVLILLLVSLFYLFFPGFVSAYVGWHESTPLPYNVASHVAESIGSGIAIVGGSASMNETIPDFFYAPFDQLGGITNWQRLGSFPKPTIWSSSAEYSGIMYVIGGNPDGSDRTYSNINLVYYRDYINGGQWKNTNPLPYPVSLSSSVAINGYLYLVGGYRTRFDDVTPSAYYSKINSDGTLGEWVQTESLPLASAGGTLIEKNGYLYYIGKQDSEHTFRSKVKDDGSLEPWTYHSALPTQVFRPSVVLVGDAIYVIGGISQGSSVPQDKIFKSVIATNGDLSAWEHVGSFPRPHCCSPAIEHLGNIFILGGHDGTNYYSKVLVSEKIDTIPSPTPTQTPTPSPSPTPSPIPPSKTILITGLGASWNSEAILGCKKDGYSGTWSAAPFSEKIYDPLINAFHSSGNYIYPFYYDYRRDVTKSAQDLAKYIADLTEPNEQVNLVGHSLGGLIGRSYIENLYSFKVKKFITVGSPNAGLARAYGAWAGGEIWSDNTIFRIAQSSLLRYCSGLFGSTKDTVRNVLPVIQNLLPTYDYLRTWNKDRLVPISEMQNRNNFLPQSFLSVNFSPEFMTLTGTGKQTVKEIVVRDRSVIDKMRNVWEDGKPFRNINSKDGDDSVLASSSRIVGQKDVTINESHWGVISSARGVQEIMKFLGLPVGAVSNTTEPVTGFLVTTQTGSLNEGKRVLWIEGRSANNIKFKPNNVKSTIEVGYFDNQGTEVWRKSDFSGQDQVNFDLAFDDKLKKINLRSKNYGGH